MMILLMIVNILMFIVFAQVVISLLINFDVLNPRQPLVYQIWSGLNRLLEPIYGPIRRILPPMGGLDFSPMVVIIGLYAIEIIITNNLRAF
jgi:YggT family protein